MVHRNKLNKVMEVLIQDDIRECVNGFFFLTENMAQNLSLVHKTFGQK